ncbi:bis(5'-nucleosyl)-tetraphosphatase (symmetrical) YqeK [Slackia heliotrinireducens]|uniref:bis(5'-nucleosyl)-tetraphosphatase (symmetrical) YqeK n=1 Tax=Slackia heliotrinireducens TaxID=84110 RepID=UPI0033161328
MVDVNRFDEMRERLKARVKPTRYMHSLGVSQTAEQLARIYGVDESEAAVAGLLHDWDKALSKKEVREKAKRLCPEVPKEVRKNAVGVLHSFTAGASLRDEFPELSDAVLQAIYRHTCGDPDMTDLDMVIYVADMIEPGRDFEGVEDLRAAVGEVDLDELYYLTYQQSLLYLVRSGKTVFPGSLGTWNALVLRREASLAERVRDATASAEVAENTL